MPAGASSIDASVLVIVFGIFAAAKPSEAIDYKVFDVYHRNGDIEGYLNETQKGRPNRPDAGMHRQLQTPPASGVWDPPTFASRIFAQRRSPTTDVIAFSQ